MKVEVAQSSRLVFHPYVASMVPKYHSWMQDEELLRLTGSEPLTLEEEVLNRQSWVEDPMKCTFILCDKAVFIEESPEQSMIGDLNLFLNETASGEVNIMIAEASYRRKGSLE
mmetsp:Transcript_26052/g.46225  ORF Transcript_26052/g.46225 Transcript_26052/m.46225 type:complete len:113 (+) Transcript_26052:381-719(+)